VKSLEPREPRGKAVWQMLEPLQLCGPENIALSRLQVQASTNVEGRRRRVEDGSKLICGLDVLDSAPPFTVLSLGSNNNWVFETAVIERFGSRVRVHTYDCTINTPNPPSHITHALTFHKTCINARDGVVNGNRFVSWTTMMRELKAGGGLLGRVEVLKADIEGNEREWLWDMLSDPNPEFPLPPQISMELHLPTVSTRGHFLANVGQRYASTAEIAALAVLWHAAGYRLIVREDNPIAQRGTELLLLNVAGC